MWCIDASPDRKTLAIGCQDHHVRLFSIAGERMELLGKLPALSGMNLHTHPYCLLSRLICSFICTFLRAHRRPCNASVQVTLFPSLMRPVAHSSPLAQTAQNFSAST